jgi:chromosome segregation ATPase
MKWLGWVVFIISLMACFAISSSNKQKLVEQQAAADKYLAAEKDEVQRMLDSQSERNASFEKQLQEEEAKVPPLQKQLDELLASQKELNATIETKSDSIANLKEKIADVKSATKDSSGTSKEAERRIANAEKEIEILKRAIPSVRVQ